MKRIIGIIWINLGIAAVVFETFYIVLKGNNSVAIIVYAAGTSMLWQGITMVRNAKRDTPKDK